MFNKIGFIGTGNMAEAMISGIISSQQCLPENIIAVEINQDRAKFMQEKYGIKVVSSVKDINVSCDVMIIALKPFIIPIVLPEMSGMDLSQTIIVSVAAGVTLAQLEGYLSKNNKIIRAMPNTPALIKVGMTSLTPNSVTHEKDLKSIQTLFESFSKTVIVPENMIHAIIAVSGSAPAFVYTFIEALADAGVSAGLSREMAYTCVAQTLVGSAQMVMETNTHPGQLKDMVCSPAGTTIAGMMALEEHGFRKAIQKAAQASIKKSIELSQDK